MDDAVRPRLVDDALDCITVEKVTWNVRDSFRPRRWYAHVQPEHRMAASRQELGKMEPDKASVASDENSQ